MPWRLFIKGDCRFGNNCKFDHRKPKNILDFERKLLADNQELKLRIDDMDASIKRAEMNAMNA